MPTHVEIILDKPRKLKYNVNAMCELEEMFGGQGLASIFEQGRAGFTQIRALLYVGLKYGGDNSITPIAVGDLISDHILVPGKSLEDAFGYIQKAMDKGGFRPKQEGNVQSQEVAQPK